MTWVGDLEADGLKFECTQVWCIVNYDLDTKVYHISVPKEWFYFFSGYMNEDIKPSLPLPDKYILYESHTAHLRAMEEIDTLVYHNGINFDLMAIQKLYPWWSCKKMEDTFVLSSLFNPDRPTPKGAKGPHSIDAWARRFNMWKPEHDDWSKFTLSMLYRCVEDVKIGVKTWLHLDKKRKEWDWEQAIALEYGVAKYHAQQEMNGCPFNLKLAYELLDRLDKEIVELEERILIDIPPNCKMEYSVEVKKPFLKNGDYSASTYEWFCDQPYELSTVHAPFTRISFQPINLNSDQQVKAYLLTQGWKPTTWNYKKDNKTKRWVYDNMGKKIPTSPKLTEDSYGSIKTGIGKLLARRSILLHRRRTISNIKDPENKGLISFIRSDGRIPAEAAPQATNTGRYRHKKIVNIPKAKEKIVYGKEMRSLFYVG
jgi:hypothetical protein